MSYINILTIFAEFNILTNYSPLEILYKQEVSYV